MNGYVKSIADCRLPIADCRLPSYIIVSGYGLSGNSAARDIIREFGSCYLLPIEFRTIKDPYGLDDLYHAVVNKRGWYADIAVKDFIKYMQYLDKPASRTLGGLNYKEILEGSFEPATKNFIASLVNFEYKNDWWMFDLRRGRLDHFLRDTANRILRRLHMKYRFTTEEISYFTTISQEEFFALAQKYMDDIFTPIAAKKGVKNIVVHNAFNASSIFNCRVSRNFFRSPKLVSADRDPRDNYANFLNWDYGIGKEFRKTRDVHKFIEMYRADRIYQQEYRNTPGVLLLRFEDLVLHYEESVKRIAEFIGLDLEDHIHKRKFFDPDISIKNVGIYKNVLSDYEIDAITCELAEYLYTD